MLLPGVQQHGPAALPLAALGPTWPAGGQPFPLPQRSTFSHLRLLVQYPQVSPYLCARNCTYWYRHTASVTMQSIGYGYWYRRMITGTDLLQAHGYYSPRTVLAEYIAD